MRRVAGAPPAVSKICVYRWWNAAARRFQVVPAAAGDLADRSGSHQYNPPVPLLRTARSASGETGTGPPLEIWPPLLVSVPMIE